MSTMHIAAARTALDQMDAANGAEDMDAVDVAVDAYHSAIERLLATPATTVAELSDRASIALKYERLTGGDDSESENRLAFAVLHALAEGRVHA